MRRVAPSGLFVVARRAANRGVRARVQVRCLVDVPGERLPSAATGELAKYLRGTVAPQARPRPGGGHTHPSLPALCKAPGQDVTPALSPDSGRPTCGNRAP